MALTSNRNRRRLSRRMDDGGTARTGMTGIMTRPEAGGATGAEAERHARLLAHFAELGYAPVQPPVLQPVEPFLELSGEEIRRRIFVTSDGSGAELCLRPEFTIPVCRLHQATRPGQSADYSCLGPVFRVAAGEADEFTQAGLESIGRTDTPAADAEILGLALEGLAQLGRGDVSLRLGDMGLTHALLDALAVPPVAKRRTLRAIAAGRPLAEVTNASQPTTRLRASSRRSRGRTRRVSAPSSRTSSPSREFPESEAAAPVRSPSVFSPRLRRRLKDMPASMPRTARSSSAIAPSKEIPTPRSRRCGR